MIFGAETHKTITFAIGPFEIINDRRKDSVRTGVLEVLSHDGRRFFVKIHNRLSRWNPEVYAYGHWTKPLGQYAPDLIASFDNDNVFGIIITPIQGRTVNEARITDTGTLGRIYHEAGRLFKKMQGSNAGDYFGIPKSDGSPYEENAETDPVRYVSGSVERLYKSAYDNTIIDSSFAPLIKWSLDNCGIFKDEVPVPTNWDLSPNNWMVDEDGSFNGFIDFENMLWGIPLDSFAVIKERYAFDKPFLKESFLCGYGLEQNEVTEVKQKILGVKSSIASIVYGHDSGNPYFFDCGIKMLRHIADNHKI